VDFLEHGLVILTSLLERELGFWAMGSNLVALAPGKAGAQLAVSHAVCNPAQCCTEGDIRTGFQSLSKSRHDCACPVLLLWGIFKGFPKSPLSF
jgi:hypothetical protein